MKSFGRLLRKMRGKTSLENLSNRTSFDVLYLQDVESSKIVVDEKTALHLLCRGFDLDAVDAQRAVLGIQLYDLGLKDNEIRQLVLDVISGEASESLIAQVRHLCREYTL